MVLSAGALRAHTQAGEERMGELLPRATSSSAQLESGSWGGQYQ